METTSPRTIHAFGSDVLDGHGDLIATARDEDTAEQYADRHLEVVRAQHARRYTAAARANAALLAMESDGRVTLVRYCRNGCGDTVTAEGETCAPCLEWNAR